MVLKKKRQSAPKKQAPAVAPVVAPTNDSNSFLGQDYPYYKYIKSPSAMGMSSKGDMKTLAKDVSGIQSYISVLLSSITGNISDAKGLFPGILSNLNVLNPNDLLNVFNTNITPQCMPVNLQIINDKNVVSSETNYIATMDIENMDPCSFPNKINPVTKAKCSEGFVSNIQKSAASDAASVMMPDDPLVKLYYAGLSALGIYILYRLMKKSK